MKALDKMFLIAGIFSLAVLIGASFVDTAAVDKQSSEKHAKYEGGKPTLLKKILF
jgi:hypothetical protein